MPEYKGRYLGYQFGNYQLIRLLGRGGFAEVYLGEHIHMETQAAVKVLTSELTPEEIAQFRNEARTIFSLEHPNIVRVLDYGLNGNIPYIVMNYAANGSLKKRHPRGTRVPLPTVVEYVRQIAAALQYAHDEKLVHRDIKPDNMLIGKRDDILLSDFGIVAPSTSVNPQQSVAQIGTWIYIAPEQITRHPVRASDQYALGVTVYEWLSGRPPFEGDWYNLYHQHLNVAPPSLRERVPDLPAAVEQVVIKALAKIPQDRYPTIQEFAQALEAASKGSLPPTRMLLVVARSGGDYTSINAAIAAAEPKSRILVRPGTYRESIILDKPIEINGDGSYDQVIIESSRGNCISMQTDKAIVRNLTLRGCAGQQGGKYHAVDIPQGKLLLENCDISSDSLAGVAIHNFSARPIVRQCVIHDSKGDGVLVYENGQGEIDSCDIFGNAPGGISIKDGGNPILRNCTIHDNKSGVWIYRSGQGVIETCDIFGHDNAGVIIKDGGNPTLRNCTIHDNQNGVFAQRNGQGIIDACDISGNATAGVVISEGGNPTMRSCTIHDTKGMGVCVEKNGQGVIDACDISGNAFTGVVITSGGNPRITRCHINRNTSRAILAYEQGAGVVEDCDLTDNKAGPTGTTPDSTTRLSRNRT